MKNVKQTIEALGSLIKGLDDAPDKIKTAVDVSNVADATISAASAHVREFLSDNSSEIKNLFRLDPNGVNRALSPEFARAKYEEYWKQIKTTIKTKLGMADATMMTPDEMDGFFHRDGVFINALFGPDQNPVVDTPVQTIHASIDLLVTVLNTELPLLRSELMSISSAWGREDIQFLIKLATVSSLKFHLKLMMEIIIMMEGVLTNYGVSATSSTSNVEQTPKVFNPID